MRVTGFLFLATVFCVTAIPLLVGGTAIFLMGRHYGEEPLEKRVAVSEPQPAKA